MVGRISCPERGDIVWLDFSPIRGHEQGGKRPALVISDSSYNTKTSLCISTPVTSKVKGYAFEVALPPASKTQGVILSDQVRNLDWRARRATFIEKAPPEIVARVVESIVILAQDS